MMKYKFIAELINENMEIIHEVEVKVEEDNKLGAKIKAEKKVKKQHGAAPKNHVWVLNLVDKKNQNLLPMQRLIKYLQQQIKDTRSVKANASKKFSQFAEHRRTALKLCLLEANRELKSERLIIDAFHDQREKDWIALASEKSAKNKGSKKDR